ncbi:TadE/TadG family type IV pilus assembly protein [Brevibacillus sp. BC25]|uniref:TadE/TadG family type IV pilus assembly protein n=1 Tax=Brevibacillus sp. BC25 TaxID=1144308 RepID=UPI0002711A95|nr:TadE/TadG family type IV pilus assembly protein [Brevibacillus sp. BC25]EJL25151.1 TadE-like protein [Brevibacillus sp. BC25]
MITRMGRVIRTRVKDERGSQMIEFILVFPLVWILIVFSFDQFSMMYNKQKALAAAYEAGRIAAVQPNFGLAKFHSKQRGTAELAQGIGVLHKDVQLELDGNGWRKGSHVKAEATVSFRLLATGELYEITESYHMMVENAEEKQ